SAPELSLPPAGDDDRQTQRLQAKHFQALVASGQPATPALLEAVDWYGDADGAADASRSQRAPEAVLDDLGREPSQPPPEQPPSDLASAPATMPRASIEMPPVAKPAEAPRKEARKEASFVAPRFGAAMLQPARSSGTRVYAALIVIVLIALACYVG